MRLDESQLPQPVKEKRAQKYQGFSLQPGDRELLDRLPAHHRVILQAEGDYKTIAANLGIAMGTVRSRLHRARAALTELRQSHSELPAKNDGPLN
jgi:DNA-directed RNA polymerase specialized sigma24 family protein